MMGGLGFSGGYPGTLCRHRSASMAAWFIIADRPGPGATSSGSSSALFASSAILVRPVRPSDPTAG